jgi:hypothetical protein
VSGDSARAAAGTYAASTIVSFSREMRKELKARIQFPREHSMAGEKNQPLSHNRGVLPAEMRT